MTRVERPQPTPPADKEGPSLGVDFSWYQREDPIFFRVYEHLAMVNREVTEPHRANRGPGLT